MAEGDGSGVAVSLGAGLSGETAAATAIAVGVVVISAGGVDGLLNSTTEPVLTVGVENGPDSPGITPLPQTIKTTSANSIAPAVAIDGVNRKWSRSQSNQLTVACTETERGALRCVTRSWPCMMGVAAISSTTTLATGFVPNVAATSAKTCFFS